jgi:putative ABC transport system permease protein
MSLLEALDDAIRNLGKHKLRTSLTMLGMIFGVGAVIAMLSIGAGGEREALETISRLGLHNVLVRATEIEVDQREEIRKKSLGVSLRDGEAIQQAIDEVELVLPRVRVRTYRIGADGGRTTGDVYGISWRQPEITAIELADGRFFDRLDEERHAQVAVIGPEIRRDLFGERYAVGRYLKVNDVWLEVIGVLGGGSEGSATMEGVSVGSSAREILIPVSTAMRKFTRDPLDAPVDELIIRLRPGTSTARVAAVIEPLLDRLHGGAEDFQIVVPEALLEQRRRTQRIFNIVMGSIAGISLLVGGIGIMNIMLATVLERTREIGVRRALGATRRDIRVQFVIESFTISVLGGVVGIIVGIMMARIVAAYAGWPTVVQVSALLLSTGVSIVVGLASGIYPATRAAELDPIEALRYE